MSIVVRGLAGNNLVVRGLAETYGTLAVLPISDPFATTEALLSFLFTTMEPSTRETSATFSATSELVYGTATDVGINKPNTAAITRPLTAVIHRTGTTVLVHGGQ